MNLDHSGTGASSNMLILRVRSFTSKPDEGFVLFLSQPLPEHILQDILFQLFAPLFPKVLCPQIYYFSSTDEIISHQEVYYHSDFVYIHFLERVEFYKHHKLLNQRLKLGTLASLAKGIDFDGVNLYVFSENQFNMYADPIFLGQMGRRVNSLVPFVNRKWSIYSRFCSELTELSKDSQIPSLSAKVAKVLQEETRRIEKLDELQNRYLKAQISFVSILNEANIKINSVKDIMK